MPDSPFKTDRTSSNRAGVTLMNNQVGYVVAQVMRDKKDITIRELPSMIRVDGINKIDFDFQEIADAAKSGMLPKFQQQPGFLRYGVADAGDKTLLSISLWASRKDADAAVLVAANWVRENLGDKLELRKNLVGDLAFFEGVHATV